MSEFNDFDDFDLEPLEDIIEDLDADDEIEHYGTPRHSGRYPWGSGDDPYQSAKSFVGYVSDLEKSGLSEKDIADHMEISIRELRDRKKISKNDIRKEQLFRAEKLKAKNYSTTAIGRELGLNESSVRSLLKSSEKIKSDKLNAAADVLQNRMADGTYLDIGSGVEMQMGVSRTQFDAAVTKLKMQGYEVINLKQQQATTGHETSIKVLAPPGTTFKDVAQNRTNIKMIASYSEDGGRTFSKIEEPRSVSPDRVKINWAEESGLEGDGMMYIRRGVEDLNLGNKKYAQVRIRVGEDKFIKGMAMYNDDMPKGVDIVFNTNKSKNDPKIKGDKLEALKTMEDNPDLPFGSVIRQKHYIDKNGNKQLSALNIVNEEGKWSEWSKTLSSQMLSKQPPKLAKQQLDVTLKAQKAELDEIISLENPTVKKKLLQSFADGADASAVSLKAAPLPRTAQHVIIPISKMKDNEIYAPNYRNGERVVLIRHPHGGIFEIPELIVNNKNPEGKRLIGNDAKDGVGINARVAARLSGADFDGDTVLVIPNNNGAIKTAPTLEGLKNFDPSSYKVDHDTITGSRKQKEMGQVSNLITDMTIKGATTAEISRAVRHSMVVIDSEKHKLDWKRSEADHGIPALRKKYQSEPGRNGTGASTIVSKAKGRLDVPERKARSAKNGGPIDPKTGQLMWEPTGRTVAVNGKEKLKTIKTTKMAEAKDAHSLSSGRPIEAIYADYANGMKALANQARKEMVWTPNMRMDPVAKKTYATEVARLKADLDLAISNAPKERQAQLIAGSEIAAIKRAYRAQGERLPKDREKKLAAQFLADARHSVGAGKNLIPISPKQWEAIQAGAVSSNMLEQVLNNTDLDVVRKYATPRTANSVSPSKLARIKAMSGMGYTQAEIADHLGISTSMVSEVL